jgi:hypothetical protein
MNRIQNVLAKVLDQWSFYDYKESFTSSVAPMRPPQWIPEDDLRRLKSYAVLESYCRNASRHWLQSQALGTGELSEAKKDRREYGDPTVLVETALSSVIGNQARIVTEGSVDLESTEASFSVIQQRLLEEWAEREMLEMKYWENERQAIKLGDSVMAIGWDSAVGRPRANVYDPGFYFPVFDKAARGGEDFPEKVHIAWEFEDKNAQGQDEVFVRKITWELTIQEAAYTARYDGGGTTNVNCQYSDGIWPLSGIGTDGDFETFSPSQVVWITPAVMLDIDFVPVVHFPNTVNIQGHFGTSVLANVLQILDDVQATDTDVQASAATTGSPPIVISGKGNGSGTISTYGPGTVLYVGDGNATVVDTSRSLDALLKLKDALLSRLSINSRTPEALLGRVKPNEVPSGIALTLGFTPHINMIREMRMVRRQKYSLMFKFVLRFYQQAGLLEAAPLETSELVFGSFLPADKSETMTLVQNLLTSKAISLETAVQMLMEAGYPIEDWVTEIQRIQSRDFTAANDLMLLTGDPASGLEYLGLPADTPVFEDPMAENDPIQ